MDQSARHLRLLTETIAAVNSTLDLQEEFRRGGTHGSPTSPLLHRAKPLTLAGLPPGKAGLRPPTGDSP
jgi:hypothetical protein